MDEAGNELGQGSLSLDYTCGLEEDSTPAGRDPYISVPNNLLEDPSLRPDVEESIPNMNMDDRPAKREQSGPVPNVHHVIELSNGGVRRGVATFGLRVSQAV